MRLPKDYRLFVLDMDGTFYLGDRVLPGALEFIEWVRSSGRQFVFLTNNSSRTAVEYVKKLGRLGLDTTVEHVMTSGDATIEWLKQEDRWSRLYVCGTPPVQEDFRQAGFVLTPDDPQAVIVTYDTTLTYEKLVCTSRLLRRGLPFVATHPDHLCPSPEGPLPDLGSFLALFQVANQRKPDMVVGKPNPQILRSAMHRMATPADQTLMIGDRLYTDIRCGLNAAVDTALVLSGETTRDMLPTTDHPPTYVLDGLLSLAP
jgi:4-nitrophenyl phosphatase/NagD protein